MPYYAQLTDIRERIAVVEEDLLYADDYINSLLRSKGLPAPVSPVPVILKQLAILIALHRACVRLAQAEDTTLMEKAKIYREMAKDLEDNINPSSLGLNTTIGLTSAKMERA